MGANVLKRGKDNRKTPIGTTKMWPWPLNRGDRLIGVLFTVFY